MRIASQVKALLAGGRVSRRQDPAGVAGFFLRGAVPEPFTLYEGVRALPAGSFVWVGERGASEPEAFASVPALLAEAVEHASPLSEAELQERFRRAFLESVRYHLVADVRVGMFLSSGRDSTSTVALAREAGATDLKTVTLTFSEYQGSRRDEAPLAEEVARHYGTDHSTVMISKADFVAEFPRVIEAMDQPTTDAVNSYFVSLAAARCGLKVALSGTGGDELLGGYGTYRKVPMMVKLARVPSKLPLLPEALHRAYLALTPKWSTHISQKHGAILKYGGSYAGAYFLKRAVFMPWDLPELMGAEAARAGLERLDMIGLIGKALTPDPRQPFLRMVVPRVVHLHARPVAARHRLGEHGALARGPGAARRAPPAARGRAAARTRPRQPQAVPREEPRGRSPAGRLHPRQDRLLGAGARVDARRRQGRQGPRVRPPRLGPPPLRHGVPARRRDLSRSWRFAAATGATNSNASLVEAASLQARVSARGVGGSRLEEGTTAG